MAITIQQRVGLKGRGPVIEEIAEGYTDVARRAGELLAIYRALEIARQREFYRIKIRSDFNAMRRQLRDDFRSGQANSGLRGCVLLLARSFEWVDFGYVPRRKNHIASCPARPQSDRARVDRAVHVERSGCPRPRSKSRCNLAPTRADSQQSLNQ